VRGGQAEGGKARPGVCPTEGDLDGIDAEVTAGTREVAGQLTPPDPACPAGYLDRSPSEVVDDYLAAYAAGDGAALACAYHPAAFRFDDQGLLIGPADIVASLMSLRTLFGNVPFQVWQTDEFEDTIRLLYALDGGWVVIPDGADTMIIRRGQIRLHTTHALIEFTGPPPELAR
jgi:hypothetical protein